MRWVEDHIRTWTGVLLTAFFFFGLATMAGAKGYDYDSAVKTAETDINSKNYFRAFRIIKEIGNNAYKENNPYGKYLFFSTTAKLYNGQGDIGMAERNYRSAIEVAEKSLSKLDIGDEYLELAKCLDRLTRRSEGVDILKKALGKLKTDKSKAILHIQLAKMLYWEKMYDDYLTNYNRAAKFFGKEISDDISKFLTVIKEIIEGNTEKAEQTAMGIKNREDRSAALREVYVATGDYRKAYPIFQERARLLETKEFDQGKSYHIAEMDAELVNDQLKLSRLKLEYDMAQQKNKMGEEKKLLDASRLENVKIKLANDSQLIAKMRADSLVSREEAEEREAEYEMLIAKNKRQRITMYFGIALFLLLIGYSVFAWMSNRLVIRHLKMKQKLLTEALDKAQEAERMKTVFVDNLGYEVKAPMNKVLGLVENALARMESMSNEEKGNIEKEISDTAEGLTATLNDVLKNSLAESGKKMTTIIVVGLIMAASLMPCVAYAQTDGSLTEQRRAWQMLVDANERMDRYGQYEGMKRMGDVQMARRCYRNAIQLYIDAYVVFLKNQLDADPTEMLINLGRLYRMQCEYDDAAHYLNEVERYSKTDDTHYLICIEKARLAFETNNKPDFVRHYAEIKKMKAEKGMSRSHDEVLLDIMNMLYDGKRKEAMQRAERELTDEEYLRMAELDCANNGEWKEACELFQKEIVLHRQKIKSVFEADRKEMGDIAGNNLLETRNIQMKLASTNLNIEHFKQQEELTKYQQARHKLMMDNNALVINRMKSEQKLSNAVGLRKEAVMRMQQEQSELNRSIFFLSIILAIILMAFLASYLWHSHKSKKQLREKNDELNAAIRKAHESEKMKSTFIQNMSHEIRTPLNAIVGFSKLLLSEGNELDSKEKENFVNIIRSNEDMLKQLIDDVMSLHELHSGQYKMTYSLVSANELCRTSIETVRHRARPDVPILFTTNVDDKFLFSTDGMRMAQVIINFLTNAIKYTEEGNITVDCSLDPEAKMLTVSVADTGCGIPKEKQQEIFERFAKLDSFHQGTGLGLNICHVISQRLGGKVGIDPEYDKGSRFFLTLPVK